MGEGGWGGKYSIREIHRKTNDTNGVVRQHHRFRLDG